MTLLFVVAVVMLSVRIAAVLVWLTHHHDNRVDVEERRKARVDHQVRTLRVPARDYLTRDNVSVRVEAVVHYRLVAPGEAPTPTQHDHGAMSRMVQTSLRSAIGKVERDDLLSNRDLADDGPVVPQPTREGPQDAPPYGPRDAAGNPQDAVVEPQGTAEAGLTMTEVDDSVDGIDTPGEGQPPSPDVKADPRPTTKAVSGVAAGRRMTLVRLGRGGGAQLPAGDRMRERAEKAILSSVPRPVTGPACLGGRGDAGYLRGWDDAVDWIAKGNEANPPTWGDVAYMTGWNDATRAIAKAGQAAKTSPDPQTASCA